MSNLPAKARAVIIGGGVSGCSMAYHLAKLGWTDIVLLERKQLTSGTTWHAAGLIGQLRGSQNMTRLAKYSADLYVKLEAETGVATGMRIREVPISTRYFDEASQIGFWRSVRYGLEILKTMVLYKLHKKHIYSHRIFRDPVRVPAVSKEPISRAL